MLSSRNHSHHESLGPIFIIGDNDLVAICIRKKGAAANLWSSMENGGSGTTKNCTTYITIQI
uniref:Uncharacterized protein n=1 Tax=Megaselia scalaris TaxID=36166 RepID=T1H3Y4_MEGSC